MRRTPLRAVSSRRRDRDAVYGERREEARARAGGRCEAGATLACAGECEQTHHRAGRVGPDPHAVENLLCVCAACHAWIHAHPAEARSRGWSTTRLGLARPPISKDDPDTDPVF